MLWKTFRLPLAILVLSLIGLIWALMADGFPDLVATLLVAVPLTTLHYLTLLRLTRSAELCPPPSTANVTQPEQESTGPQGDTNDQETPAQPGVVRQS